MLSSERPVWSVSHKPQRLAAEPGRRIVPFLKQVFYMKLTEAIERSDSILVNGVELTRVNSMGAGKLSLVLGVSLVVNIYDCDLTFTDGKARTSVRAIDGCEYEFVFMRTQVADVADLLCQ